MATSMAAATAGPPPEPDTGTGAGKVTAAWATAAFEAWREANQGDRSLIDNLVLLEATSKGDGATVLQLLLYSGVECRMTLQPNTPNTNTPATDGTGTTAAGTATATISGGGAKLERWRLAVNATAAAGLVGVAGSLGTLFTVAVTQYAEMCDAMHEGGGDDDDDDDDSDSDSEGSDDDGSYGAGSGGSDDSDGEVIDDDAFFTTDWEVEIARNKKRWLAKEEELRSNQKKRKTGGGGTAGAGAGAGSSGSSGSGLGSAAAVDASKANQIFSSIGSSNVLVNDLVKIMENTAQYGFSAEPVDDNIYKWIVNLSGFAATSPIHADLQQLQRRHGYGHVVLQLDFTIDLFPFYPPLVKIVRPRLKDSMMQRICNLETFQLTYWHPAHSVSDSIIELRGMLEQWCQLDYENEMNDAVLFPTGAYYSIEHALLQLALVSEVKPRANKRYVVQAELAPKARAAEPAEGKGKYWKAGTGYGHGARQRTSWDPKAYALARQEKDRQLERVVAEILAFLVAVYVDESIEVTADLGAILEGSSLIPFLELLLKTDSIVDMAERYDTYNTALSVVELLAGQPDLVFLIAPLDDQTRSLCQLVTALGSVVSIFKRTVEKGAKAGASIDPAANPAMHDSSAFRIADRVLQAAKTVTAAAAAVHDSSAAAATLEDAQPPARQTRAATKSAAAAAGAAATTASSDGSEIGASASASASASRTGSTAAAGPSGSEQAAAGPEHGEDLYVLRMRAMQLDECEIFEAGSGIEHKYKTIATAAGPPRQAAVIRLAQEMSSLGSSLPCNLSSSVFVRVDEDRMDLMKALIIGPDDTPYAGGCFEFDIYFPPGYPSEPPKVNLNTTGKQSFRFNPNLYASGKVCLSLLGTWEGQAGEQWIADSSTLLQVLVSIQSLILVPEPFFNEPGYEAEMGTPVGKDHSDGYNQNIRAGCMRFAILGQLKLPSPAFKDVIESHFRMRKVAIMAGCKQWVDDATQREAGKPSPQFTKHIQGSDALHLNDLYTDIKTKLDEL